MNLKHQDVVCIFLPNTLDFLYTEFACYCGGYILFSLNPLFTKIQLERLLPRVNPAVIVTSQLMRQKIPDGYNLCYIDQTAKDDIEHGIFSMMEIKATKAEKNYIEECAKIIELEDPCFYGLTSGSTGDAKICVYPQKSLVMSTATRQSPLPNAPIEIRKALCSTPLFTASAHFQMNFNFTLGSTFCVVDKFDPAAIIDFVAEEKLTGFSHAPSGALAIINNPKCDKEKLKTLKYWSLGGAVVSDNLLHLCYNKFDLVTCISSYGMTEFCGLVYYHNREKAFAHDNCEIRIVDHITRKITPVGVPGEIEVRKKYMMKEYLNNPEANKAFIEDGWFRTGDEGSIDKNGKLTITGRIKDLIIRGGHNVYPSEIIDTLQSHPKVKLAGCISVPDRALGEMIVAFVEVKEPVEKQDLKEFCRKRLTSYAIPTHIFVLEQIPLNSFGKVYNPALKQIAVGKIKEYWEEKCKNNTNGLTTEGGKQIAALWSQWFDIPLAAISKKMNLSHSLFHSIILSQQQG